MNLFPLEMPIDNFCMGRFLKNAEGGKVYVCKKGTPADKMTEKGNFLTVYKEENGEQTPITQPIILNQVGLPVVNGVVATILCPQEYALAVYDAYGEQQFYFSDVQRPGIDQFEQDLASGLLPSITNYQYGLPEIVAGSVLRTLQSKMDESVSICDFGAKCDGVTDDTAAIHAALNSKYKRITMPEGTIVVSNLIFPTKQGYSLVGAGSGLTVIKATGTGVAMSLDAFPDPEDSTQPFMYNVNLKGFSLTGDAYTIGIDAQGIARSQWEDIRVNGSTKEADSVSYRFSGCHLNRFTSIFTSYGDGDVPYTGILLRAGTRAHINIGGCSNNYFSHIYPEGNSIGLQLAANGADQNVFDIGAPEACKVYGQVVGSGCRYNKFIGMGYENKDATSASVADGGFYSSYESCYSNSLFRVDPQARGLSIIKGYFDGIFIQKGAISTEIKDITVGTWGIVDRVLADLGTDTKVLNVFNGRTNKYLPPSSARVSVAVSGSPFTWTNESHSPVKVLLYGGSVTKVSIGQPNETETSYDKWEEPKPLPASFGGEARGVYILMPRQLIEISFVDAPTMNVLPLRFMQ